jgi:hypothetical protein
MESKVGSMDRDEEKAESDDEQLTDKFCYNRNQE